MRLAQSRDRRQIGARIGMLAAVRVKVEQDHHLAPQRFVPRTSFAMLNVEAAKRLGAEFGNAGMRPPLILTIAACPA